MPKNKAWRRLEDIVIWLVAALGAVAAACGIYDYLDWFINNAPAP